MDGVIEGKAFNRLSRESCMIRVIWYERSMGYDKGAWSMVPAWGMLVGMGYGRVRVCGRAYRACFLQDPNNDAYTTGVWGLIGGMRSRVGGWDVKSGVRSRREVRSRLVVLWQRVPHRFLHK